MPNPKLTEKANAIYHSIEEEPKKEWSPPNPEYYPFSGYSEYGLFGIPFAILLFMLVIPLHSL